MDNLTQGSPDPWDQIIIISQQVVNQSFKQIWILADPESHMKHYAKTLRSGTIDTYLKAPSIELQVTKSDPMLYFVLPFSDEGAGYISVFLSEDPDDDSTIKWDTLGWKWRFPVTIQRKVVPKDSQEYADFQSRAGLPNSVFSLEQLYIDASSSTLLDKDSSYFGKHDGEYRQLTPEARSTFDTFVQKWLDLSAEKGTSILGYSAQREREEELNKYAPTFPPTSIDYYAYPWKGSDGTSAPKDGDDNNAISYLMMNNFTSPPDAKMLPYTSAWVAGASSVYCMSADVFWGWMLPVLREVSIGTMVYPEEPSVSWNGHYPTPFNSSMKYTFGDRDAGANEYTLVRAAHDVWWWHGRGKDTVEEGVTSTKTQPKPDDDSESMELNQSSYAISGRASIVEGKNEIILSGHSNFHMDATHHGPETWTTFDFALDWSITIGMVSVESGGLSFEKVNDAVSVTCKQDGNMLWDPPAEVQKERFKSGLTSALQDAVSRVENNLLDALKNQHRLFLPGEGSFVMKDPIFSHGSDLVVKLEYNMDGPLEEPEK